MFRMLQTLEREPQEDLAQIYDASPAPGRVPFVRLRVTNLKKFVYGRVSFVRRM
jgi:hypothetical protein